MNANKWWGGLLACLMSLVLVALAGCNNDQLKATNAAEKKGHDHSAWWCSEHGLPEEVCAQCSAKIAAEFKKKGDWCKEHNRPESQCFICQPELKEKFAAQYRAKEGKKPPQMEEEKAAKKDEKKT